MGLVGMKPGLWKLKKKKAGIANQSKKSPHVACLTNPINQPSSKFSPTWILLISNAIGNLQGRLYVPLGEITPEELLILLLNAWVRVQENFFAILYSTGKALQREEIFVYLRVTMVTNCIMAQCSFIFISFKIN
jgi:hypothetical protein